jgi:hypothetical protein
MWFDDARSTADRVRLLRVVFDTNGVTGWWGDASNNSKFQIPNS